jgi:hypothetical protein
MDLPDAILTVGEAKQRQGRAGQNHPPQFGSARGHGGTRDVVRGAIRIDTAGVVRVSLWQTAATRSDTAYSDA